MEGRNGLTGECVKQSDRIGAHIKERGSLVAHFVVDIHVLLKMRKKPVHVPRMEDGAECEGPDEEERCCPLDCGWSDYTPATECDKNTGTQIWSREPNNPAPSCDGAQCDGSCYEVRNCTVHCECDKNTGTQIWSREPN